MKKYFFAVILFAVPVFAEGPIFYSSGIQTIKEVGKPDFIGEFGLRYLKNNTTINGCNPVQFPDAVLQEVWIHADNILDRVKVRDSWYNFNSRASDIDSPIGTELRQNDYPEGRCAHVKNLRLRKLGDKIIFIQSGTPKKDFWVGCCNHVRIANPEFHLVN